MSPTNLKLNQAYSVEELIDKMIIDSDNGAMSLLAVNIDNASLDSLYNVLGMQPPDSFGNITISPRVYSLFFRILYNATYLNRDMSEKALELLSKTNFKDGLVGGLPDNINAAHKFGEHVISNNGVQESVELHDCGIVYYEPSPYFLCIMTKGLDIEKLKNTIKDISNLVYQEIQTI